MRRESHEKSTRWLAKTRSTSLQLLWMDRRLRLDPVADAAQAAADACMQQGSSRLRAGDAGGHRSQSDSSEDDKEFQDVNEPAEELTGVEGAPTAPSDSQAARVWPPELAALRGNTLREDEEQEEQEEEQEEQQAQQQDEEQQDSAEPDDGGPRRSPRRKERSPMQVGETLSFLALAAGILPLG